MPTWQAYCSYFWFSSCSSDEIWPAFHAYSCVNSGYPSRRGLLSTEQKAARLAKFTTMVNQNLDAAYTASFSGHGDVVGVEFAEVDHCEANTLRRGFSQERRNSPKGLGGVGCRAYVADRPPGPVFPEYVRPGSGARLSECLGLRGWMGRCPILPTGGLCRCSRRARHRVFSSRELGLTADRVR